MSFAGHVMDMIARAKANTRPRRNPFDREVRASQRVNPEFLKPMTWEVREALRGKLDAERRSRLVWERIVLVATVVLLFATGWWLLA